MSGSFAARSPYILATAIIRAEGFGESHGDGFVGEPHLEHLDRVHGVGSIEAGSSHVAAIAACASGPRVHFVEPFAEAAPWNRGFDQEWAFVGLAPAVNEASVGRHDGKVALPS